MTSSLAAPGSPRDATFVLTRPPLTLVLFSGSLPAHRGGCRFPGTIVRQTGAGQTRVGLWLRGRERPGQARSGGGRRGRRWPGPALKDGCSVSADAVPGPRLAPVTDQARPPAPALVRSGSPAGTRAPVMRGRPGWRTVARVARGPTARHPSGASRPLTPGQLPPGADQCPSCWSCLVGYRSVAVIRRSSAARFGRTPTTRISDVDHMLDRGACGVLCGLNGGRRPPAAHIRGCQQKRADGLVITAEVLSPVFKNRAVEPPGFLASCCALA